METNYNFEEIWKQKEIDVPNIADIQAKANAYKKKQMLASVCLILLLFLPVGMMVWIWLSLPNLHFLMKTGILLIVIAIVFFIFQTFQKMRIINKINPAISNQEYLEKLKILQQKQLYIQTKGFKIYFILLSLGMAFYLYGLVQKRTLLWGIFIYAVTFAWFLFIWFYIKPRRTRKQQQKIQEVISSLEKMEEDFKS